MLGFFAGPPLLSLVRASLPAGLADSRSLPALVGKQVRLAGLVLSGGEASSEGRFTQVVIEDEWGMIEVILSPQARELTSLGMVAVLEGRVEERHGQPFLVAAGSDGTVSDGFLEEREEHGTELDSNGLATAG